MVKQCAPQHSYRQEAGRLLQERLQEQQDGPPPLCKVKGNTILHSCYASSSSAADEAAYALKNNAAAGLLEQAVLPYE